MASIPLTLGVLIPSLGVSSLLYGITCVQSFSYFRTYSKKDPWWICALCSSLWVFNTLQTALVMHVVYYYLIVAAEDPILYLNTAWSLPTCVLCMVIITIQVYGFYIRRVWILSRRRYTTCILLVRVFIQALRLSRTRRSKNHLQTTLAIAHFSLSVAFFFRGVLYYKTLPQFMSEDSVKIIEAAAGVGAVMDLLVAASLYWALAQSLNGRETINLTVKIIMAYTINTGLVASISVLLALIIQLVWPNTYISIFFTAMIPSLETNGCLGSLNGRDYFKRVGSEEAATANTPTSPDSNVLSMTPISNLYNSAGRTEDYFSAHV